MDGSFLCWCHKSISDNFSGDVYNQSIDGWISVEEGEVTVEKKGRGCPACLYLPCSHSCSTWTWSMGCCQVPKIISTSRSIHLESVWKFCSLNNLYLLVILSHPTDWFMSKPHQYFCHLPAHPKYGQGTVPPLRLKSRRSKISEKMAKKDSEKNLSKNDEKIPTPNMASVQFHHSDWKACNHQRKRTLFPSHVVLFSSWARRVKKVNSGSLIMTKYFLTLLMVPQKAQAL